ncbi:MAG: hypothetical protein M3O09_07210, partial [Acidobacteriota bacterium]|nr:hypothetical protein [Acidobacteriota bacterium]
LIGSLSISGPETSVQWLALAKDGADLPSSQATLQDARQVISPGEMYDFDFQPRETGTLTMEFEVQLLPLKITEQIDIE